MVAIELHEAIVNCGLSASTGTHHDTEAISLFVRPVVDVCIPKRFPGRNQGKLGKAVHVFELFVLQIMTRIEIADLGDDFETKGIRVDGLDGSETVPALAKRIPE